MRKTTFFLSLVVLLFSVSFTFAQTTQTVKGKVVDATTQDGLPGATIYLEGTTFATVSNLDGTFELKVPAGPNILHVTYVAYLDYTKNINVEQGQTLDLGVIGLQPNAVGIEEVQVVASFAQDRKTPVAVSKIEPTYISEKLGNQEFPEILKTTPSVYATKQGGGYGDSRVNIRGFDSRNVGVLINGVPVNDMENGKVYWSNWMGLADVTRAIQVQRGLGASRLAISSVGGTINIITKTTDMKQGGNVYYAIGNDGYVKTAFTISTGLTDNGWAVTASGSHTTGNGYVEATQFEGWTYYFNVSKRFSTKSQLSFNVFGAPQWHNQRAYMRPIEAYREDPNGIKMNWDYGYRNGKVYPGAYAYNFYHKPVASLNYFLKLSDNFQISAVLYASKGRGGGRRIYGPSANLLTYGYPDGMPTSSTLLTYDHRLNYDSVMAMNAHSLTGSQVVVANSMNSHDWYGALITSRLETGNITFTGGYDGRYYKGYHYRVIDDLLGGEYFLNSSNVNRDPGTPLHEGDYIAYYNIGVVFWNGLFGQLEYSTDKFSAFVNAAGSYTQYKRIDLFQYTPEEGQVTDWKGFLTYSVKGGVNYNINDYLNVFANAGYFTRPPFMKYVFKGYTNEFNDSVKVERVLSFETGIGYTSPRFKADLYLYHTEWLDKALVRTMGDVTANITGLNALHKGIEWTGTFKLSKKTNIGTMVSVGDWKWENDVKADLYDQDNNLIGTVNVYAAGLHVSDAAQTTAALTFSSIVLPGLKVGADWTYYDRLYARFDVENRADETDRGVDAWRMPAYNLLDVNARYNFNFGKFKATLYGKVNNLFNVEYMSDGLDGNDHDAVSSYVFYGFGRTWSLGLKIRF